MPRQPEGKLVKRIRVLIADRGGRSFKIHGDDEGFQEIGIPDLLTCIYGQFVGIEVKQPSGRLRPVQRKVLNEIFAAGGVAAVVTTVGQVARLLSHLEDRRLNGRRATAICYDRGAIRYDQCKFD
jgi:hypothetical protein